MSPPSRRRCGDLPGDLAGDGRGRAAPAPYPPSLPPPYLPPCGERATCTFDADAFVGVVSDLGGRAGERAGVVADAASPGKRAGA